MAWIYLLVASLMEMVWATALKQSDSFTRLWPTVIGLTVALLSVVILTLSLRDLPIGTAYAVFTGLGALGVALVGILALNESTSPARLLCLALILVGVVGLQLGES
ncbi:multidrug efflux SMR transporter [Actinomadura sp. 6K520]|jgi:quaternary ammonium compound-resistance protein SugE|uniref:DMT family transporter n=1 Tax=Actinomadura sp. 6K520 TaxID=2530364 RepID=UPI0010501C95|nr:multidrug efflux SMR transporter [Actinomadura sp. 6K520]TDE33481.1 multidrug efflux SMR transporter [Actinomadura sp. 6K520]